MEATHQRLKPREQGDKGELSAINWLIENGHPVYLPLGHAPDVDLVSFIDGRWVGIQVKTTCYFRNNRWITTIVTRGGNQSWSGVAKYFDPGRCDFLFVVAGDGRRWFIPAELVDARAGLVLGGPKYERFEVTPGRPLLASPAA
jgi:hypothetical protein